MDRRHLLKNATSAAALLAWQRVFGRPPAERATPPAWPWGKPWPQPLFRLGVASGDVRPRSVVLWTRLAPEPTLSGGGLPSGAFQVRWQLARDAAFTDLVQEGEVTTDGGRAHSVHAEVLNLPCGSVFHYRFTAGGQHSPSGRTRTAPAPTQAVSRLRLAVASCQHFEMGFYAAHRDMARSELDGVLFLGDYIYEGRAPGGLRVRDHVVRSARPLSLDQYRRHYGTYKLDADLQACHAAHPWWMIPDDHEVRNDYDGSHDAEGLSVAQFLQVRAAAYQAYFEHQPISPSRAPQGPDARFHTAFQWGRLADLLLLDARQYKSAPACEGSVHSAWHNRVLWGCEEALSAERSMLGMGQEAWLAERLLASRAVWRFIGQGTQMAPGPIDVPGSQLLYSDGWDAFPAARERLMALLAREGVSDVVVLSGDVHRHAAANLRLRPTDVRSRLVASEFVTSSVTSPGLSEFLTQRMQRSNPDLLHLRSDERGYCLLDVTPDRVRCEFRSTPHPALPAARLGVQACFEVRRGAPGPVAVPAPVG